MVETEIDWDLGAAYDFFLSLRVLHEPGAWQLRGAWAAGVRSRLSAENREFLGEVYPFISLPAGWLVDLQRPKDGATALGALSAVDTRERLSKLMGHSGSIDHDNSRMASLYRRITSARSWTEEDVNETFDYFKMHQYRRKDVRRLVRWWADLEGFGQQILEALQEYYEVFFAEEEKRITPVLEMALERAKEIGAGLSPQALVEELALGIKYESFPDMPEVILVPSFWATPLMVFGQVSDKRHLILFGGRPDDVSLVPGEVVPDSLYRGLKALADPTRLRILRYLIREPHTPAQLARKLRLRPPTVIHHLHTLRMAQMVKITLTADEGRRYTARAGAIDNVSADIDKFLLKEKVS